MVEAGPLFLRDLADLEVVKDFASRSYGVSQILMLVGAVVGQCQVAGVLEELLAQPLAGNLQIAGFVPVSALAGRQDVLVRPVGL